MNRTSELIITLILLTICIIAYSSSLNSPFLLDDAHMIVENSFIKHPSYFVNFFTGFVTSFPIPKGMCRPILMLTFAFDYANGKLNPLGYHIINMLLHFLNGILLYLLLKTLRKNVSKILLLFISLLFIIHPINTEAVTYISSRSDLMVTFFLLSILLLYLKEKRFLLFPLYILSLGTKETALCIPIIICGYQLLFENKNIKSLLKDKKNLLFLASLGLITFFYWQYKTLYFAGFTTGKIRSILSNIILQSWGTFYYLKIFLFPFNLNIFHYTEEFNSLLKIKAIIPVLSMAALVYSIFFTRKRYPLLSLGIFLYIVGLIPKFYASLKVPLMEHHFYLPSIGIYIVLLFFLEKLYKKNKRIFLYPAVGIILIFTILTWERNYQLSKPGAPS